MTRLQKAGAAIVAALSLGRLAPGAAAQCAMCRTALLNSPESRELIAAFDSGILFLLAVPFAIFGSVIFLLWRASRKRLRAASVAGETSNWAADALRGAPLPSERFSYRSRHLTSRNAIAKE